MKSFELNNENLIKFIFPAGLLLIFLLTYFPAFSKMSIRWAGGDNNYCYLVIPLFLYLLWDRRKHFNFQEFSWSLWGLVPILLSIGLILVGELGSVETLMYIGIWGCVVGLAFTLYGFRVRHLMFPLIILLFIVPLPPFINKTLTFKLKMAASTLSVIMLRLTGISVFQDGNIIDLGFKQLQVVDACSGLRYLMPLLLLSLLVGHFFSKGL